jgi:membrane protein
LSWAILLLGAQIAYAYQNRKIYLQEKLVETVCHRDREILALRLMTSIGRRFQSGEKPAAVPEISTELEVPTKLTQQVLEKLRAGHIVTEISGDAAYVPARPLDTINAHDILHAMRVDSGNELTLPDKPDTVEVLAEFKKIEQAEFTAASPLTLLALIQQTQRKQ